MVVQNWPSSPPDYYPDYYNAKKDQDKLLAALPFEDFPLAIEQVAKVGTMGANKYSRHSWNNVPDKEQRYRDAFYRHLLEIHKGNSIDQESGLLHSSHALWNLMAMVQMECENTNNALSGINISNYFPLPNSTGDYIDPNPTRSINYG